MNHGDFPLPPSSVTGELGVWLHDVWKRLVNTPTMSYFSGTNPNSNRTGMGGDIILNISPSAISRLYIKYDNVAVPNNTSWVTIA